MTVSAIFCGVFSPQMDFPIDKRVYTLDDVLRVISRIPDGIVFDFYLDLYDEPEHVGTQKTHSALGQNSKDEVAKFAEHAWRFIEEENSRHFGIPVEEL